MGPCSFCLFVCPSYVTWYNGLSACACYYILYTDSLSWGWIIFISEKSIDIIFSICSFFNLNTQPRSSCLIQREYSGERVGNTTPKKQNSESFSLLAVKKKVWLILIEENQEVWQLRWQLALFPLYMPVFSHHSVSWLWVRGSTPCLDLGWRMWCDKFVETS